MWSGMVAFFVGVMRFLSPRWGLIRNDFFFGRGSIAFHRLPTILRPYGTLPHIGTP